eukprot:COSAG02_NODE_8141_length_2693_cov_5.218967_1_plen_87_part_00
MAGVARRRFVAVVAYTSATTATNRTNRFGPFDCQSEIPTFCPSRARRTRGAAAAAGVTAVPGGGRHTQRRFPVEVHAAKGRHPAEG